MESLSIAQVIPWVVAVLGPLAGWIIAARGKAQLARETAVTQMTTVLTKMELFEKMINDFREDNRALTQRSINVSQAAADKADQVFVVANNTNEKLQALGMKILADK